MQQMVLSVKKKIFCIRVLTWGDLLLFKSPSLVGRSFWPFPTSPCCQLCFLSSTSAFPLHKLTLHPSFKTWQMWENYQDSFLHHKCSICQPCRAPQHPKNTWNMLLVPWELHPRAWKSCPGSESCPWCSYEGNCELKYILKY